MDSTERRAFGLFALILLVTAWNSHDFYQLDEHFQILEFAGSKLGIVPTQNLPWEYAAGVRPWLQPTLFVGLCKVLQFTGIEDRFLWTFFFRLFCAACGFYALLCIYRLGCVWFPDKQVQRRHLLLCTTLGFIPFLLVRTSSENLSTSFFVIGAALILKNYYRSDSADQAISPAIWLLSGLMLGLAFQFRYQIIIMIGGLCLWLLVSAKAKWKDHLLFVTGFVIVLAVGLLADRYGNGHWTFSFYNYFRVNLLEGKTAHFGTDPFFAYFYLVLGNVFAPIILVLLSALLVFWVRNTRHVLVWITLPFFIFHCMVGHKEARFLFPLVPLTILILQMAFLKDNQLVLPPFLQTQFWHRTYKWLWRYNWFWLVLLCIFPFNIDFHITSQKLIYAQHKSVSTYYAVAYNPYRDKELTYTFYRPDDLAIIEVKDLSVMAAIAEKDPTREIYFFSEMPYLEKWPKALAERTTLINPSYFFFKWPWFVEITKPILVSLHDRIEDVTCPALFKISPRN